MLEAIIKELELEVRVGDSARHILYHVRRIQAISQISDVDLGYMAESLLDQHYGVRQDLAQFQKKGEPNVLG